MSKKTAINEISYYYGINQPTNEQQQQQYIYIVYFREGLLYILAVPFLSNMQKKFVSLYLSN